MRILIITTFFPPLNSIASLRPYTWAKYWSLQGHEVTVLTTDKLCKTSVDLKFSLEGFELKEVPYPAWIARLKSRSGHIQGQSSGQKNFLKKIVDYFRFKKGILNAARMPDFADFWAYRAYHAIKSCQQWDMIISTAGPYSVHLLGYALKKKWPKVKWVADYRDTWSDNYIYAGVFPFNRFERWLESYILKQVDLISTISQPFAETFSRRYPQKKVVTIENGFDPDDMQHLDRGSIFPLDGKFRIVHTGSIYLGKRDPTPFFQALNLMSKDPFYAPLLDKLEVLFVGPRQSNLEQLITDYEVNHWVKMSGFICRENALRMQRDAHALLFLAWNDSSVDGVLTGKIFEYLASKTAILAVGAKEMEASQRLIQEACAGYILSSTEGIIDYLSLHLKEVQKEFLKVNEDVINRYNRKHLANKLLQCVNV